MVVKTVQKNYERQEKQFPEDQSFSRKDLPYLIHKWVGEVCEQNISRDCPLWVRGLGMVLCNLGTKVGQGDFSCNKLVTISPGSAPHAGWRGTDHYQFVAAETAFSNLCASAMENHAHPTDPQQGIHGKILLTHLHNSFMNQMWEVFPGKTLVLWELFFVSFIVVFEPFLQPLSFLIKLVCLLTMSPNLLYMLF